MKTKTVVMMFALICLTSFSFAGQMTEEKGDQQGDMMSKGMMMGMEKGMGGSMMYGMMRR